MQKITYADSSFSENLKKIVENNQSIDSQKELIVSEIINSVRNDGDHALINLCNKFDGSNFGNSQDLLVNQMDLDESIHNIDPKLLSALKLAYERIKTYHQKQIPNDFEYTDNLGTTLGNKWKAIESVCVYAPGGSAIYPSSILMSAVPAIVAGVKNIVATVPSKNGKIDDSVLAACKICGIEKVYKIGGAGAIAAFALGTKSIEKVNKIVGPGNSFVALAKKQLFGIVGIDMIAGPTDILVICDNQAKPDWIAADLLSQLEHGPDSRAVLITDDENFANLVLEDLLHLAKSLSRHEIIQKSLKNSCIIIVENLEKDAAKIANDIAPEHLEIITKEPKIIADKITNAGAIFLGEYTPEAIGDYIAGPSHTLPTMSSAKFSSGLSVFDFLKRISIISCDQNSFLELRKTASILAKTEGFDAHHLSCNIRK